MKRLETVKLVCLMAAIGVGLIVDAMPLLPVAAHITVTTPSALRAGRGNAHLPFATILVDACQQVEGLCAGNDRTGFVLIRHQSRHHCQISGHSSSTSKSLASI